MSDIFISYAQADRPRIQPLVERLKKEGWSVWSDREVLPGQHYDLVIEEQLDNAKCVIVVWTKLSLKSPNVRHEAVAARTRECLIQVRIEPVSWPSTYAGLQAVDLADWKGDPSDQGFRDLCAGVKRLVEEDELKRIRRALKRIEEVRADRDCVGPAAAPDEADQDVHCNMFSFRPENENGWFAEGIERVLVRRNEDRRFLPAISVGKLVTVEDELFAAAPGHGRNVVWADDVAPPIFGRRFSFVAGALTRLQEHRFTITAPKAGTGSIVRIDTGNWEDDGTRVAEKAPRYFTWVV